jgi:hypothetical protein
MTADVNLLEGMRCPGCGDEPAKRGGHMHIVIATVADVYGDGVELDRDEGGATWEEDSYCQCVVCSHEGVVRDFYFDEEAESEGGDAG